MDAILRVFVVSPFPAVRAGLRAILGQAADLRVTGEGAALESAVQAPGPPAEAPDVVVVDPAPGQDSADLGAVDGGGLRPALVVLGPLPGDERLPADLAGRAWAYLPRDTGGEQLVAAIRAVANGLLAVDPLLAAPLLPRAGAPAGGALQPVEAGEGDLTEREREVLGLVAEGLPNKTIARRLGISEHTVKFHVAAILARLGAGSRTEAVRIGAQRGLVAL
jgi:DNA-binding NarL/FixJ family response regulator